MTPEMKEAGAAALAWSSGKSKAWAREHIETVWKAILAASPVEKA